MQRTKANHAHVYDGNNGKFTIDERQKIKETNRVRKLQSLIRIELSELNKSLKQRILFIWFIAQTNRDCSRSSPRDYTFFASAIYNVCVYSLTCWAFFYWSIYIYVTLAVIVSSYEFSRMVIVVAMWDYT